MKRREFLLVFLVALSMLGILQLGILFHEFLHTQDFKTEAICLDMTNKSMAFVIGENFTTWKGDVDDNPAISRHMEIYFLQGMLDGALIIVVLVVYFNLTFDKKD